MKNNRLLILLVAASISLAAFAQDQLNSACSRAQRSLIEYLRKSGLSPSIDTKDNSVCFNYDNVFYWVTFKGDETVLYTVHRKGVKFNDDATFKPSCASAACNYVNRKHTIKCVYNESDKRVEFLMQTYAKEPTDFQGGLGKMLHAFKNVDKTFKDSYDKSLERWRQDSIEANTPQTPPTPPGLSPLTVKSVAFANSDKSGTQVKDTDYNQPLHRSNCRFVKTRVEVLSKEKGVFKIGMKITNPDGKTMVARKGVEYAATKNFEVTNVKKPVQCDFAPFGSEDDKFWKAGEYKVEICDFENGAVLYKISFNLL